MADKDAYIYIVEFRIFLESLNVRVRKANMVSISKL